MLNEELHGLFQEAKEKLIAQRGQDEKLNHWCYIHEKEGKLVVGDVISYICYASFRRAYLDNCVFIVSDGGARAFINQATPKEIHEQYFQKIAHDSLFSRYIVKYEDGIAMLDLSKYGPSPIIASLIAFRQGDEFASSDTYHRLVNLGVQSDVAMCLSWLFMFDKREEVIRAYCSGAHGVTELGRFRVEDLITFIRREDGWTERPAREKGGEFSVHDFTSQRDCKDRTLLVTHLQKIASTKGEDWEAVRVWDLNKFVAEAIRLGECLKKGDEYVGV